jgi:tRNA pseudouridine55 synthase
MYQTKMQNDNHINNLSGIIILYKPKGETSRTTLNRLQRAVRSYCRQGHKLRVGHAGTLDPLAEGVLVACIGEATKLIEVIQMLPKYYTGTFQLGVTSDTEDVEGTIISLPNPPQPTLHMLHEVALRFVGRIRQRPPAYSALKIAGKRAYQLARQGEYVELAAREIEIYKIELVGYEYPIFRLKIECGSGTYVRSIGRDIGESLGSGAIMTALTREKIGPFSLTNAVMPKMFDDLQSAVWTEHLLPLELGVAHLPRVDLDAKTTARILMGQAVRKDEIPALQKTSDNSCVSETTLYAAFSPENYLVSLLELDDSQYVKIRKNFADRSQFL